MGKQSLAWCGRNYLMIKVDVKKQSNYPVSSPKIKARLKSYFKEEGIVSDAYVSVALVDEKKMIDLSRKYLKEKGKVHNVLSFTESETTKDFVYPPKEIIYLGEIIVCYPKAFEEANQEGKLIEKKVLELVVHGAAHLLGIHHQ